MPSSSANYGAVLLSVIAALVSAFVPAISLVEASVSVGIAPSSHLSVPIGSDRSSSKWSLWSTLIPKIDAGVVVG